MLGLFPFLHEYFQNEMYKHIYTDSSYPSHCTFWTKNKPQFTLIKDKIPSNRIIQTIWSILYDYES